MRVTIALVPMKALERAKSRLAPALPPQPRQATAEAMFLRVLATLQARNVAHGGPLSAIWVITSDPHIRALAEAHQAQVLAEEGGELNAALEQARRVAEQRGVARLLIVPGDLPLLTSDDVDEVLALLDEGADLVLAPDAQSYGTNMLALRLPSDLPFLFGEASLQRHLAAARNASLSFALYGSPTSALDVDTPDNLVHAARFLGERALQRVVQSS